MINPISISSNGTLIFNFNDFKSISEIENIGLPRLTVMNCPNTITGLANFYCTPFFTYKPFAIHWMLASKDISMSTVSNEEANEKYFGRK